MPEYIERENAYKLISEQKEKAIGMYSKGRNDGLDIAKSIIHSKEQCPSADAVEVKHGKWEVTEYNAHLNVVCSNCNEEFYVYKKGQYRIDRSDYCPKCGARMDKGGK